ncbi:MAG: hypothetical protein HWN66_17455 [Candidatus Helarchaeota archaeon]|nr:hypothetical protein [Candidatus Helarchaeota archaeon]
MTNIQKDIKEISSEVNPETLNVMVDLFKDSFSIEESRKDTLESKASMVLGFSGIIVGLVTGLVSQENSPIGLNVYTFAFIGSILCFTLSGLFALLTVKLKNFMQPFATLTPEQIDELLSKEETDIKNEIVKNYSDSLLNNQVLNNQKASKLNFAFYSATLGIFLTLVTAITAALGI